MRKVFLGGTCNESTWRERIIPYFVNENVSYFNPVVDNWDEAAQKREIQERQTCDIVLYGITPKMIGVYSIAEVVDDSNKRPHKTILVLLQNDEEMSFNKGQWKSLQRVAAMVEENGGRVFYNLKSIETWLRFI